MPILMNIHDQFDTYDRYPYTDHSEISRIAIASAMDGYRVTSYPGGIGNAYDGLVIDVKVPGGIFSDSEPVRAETSRDSGGLMVFTIGEEQRDDDLIHATGTLTTPPKREGLLLPGDDGFGLISVMHEQIRALKEPVEQTVETLGIGVNATEFDIRQTGGSARYDHVNKVATFTRGSAMVVRSVEAEIGLDLDGTTQEPLGESISMSGDHLMVYKAGKADITEGTHRESFNLELDSLVAFAGLHSRIQQLYR
jgi:hypothetical protein